LESHELFSDITDTIVDSYFRDMTAKLCRHKEENQNASQSQCKMVYTAMHGVGGDYTTKAFECFGLPPYIPTAAQQEPDPDFPTVDFPNPEEGEGALALAMETAQANGAKLILANDPDADRLAVAECDDLGNWHLFTGNELGTLLGHWQWRKYQEREAAGETMKPAAMLASTVSSKQLKAIAKHEGFLFEETLTGFKWMGNRAEALMASGYDVIFAFEQAIGFCIGDLIKDKDGVAASAVFAEMAISLQKEGFTLTSQLEALRNKYGHFIAKDHYVICRDPRITDQIFARLRQDGYLKQCGPFEVEHIRDLTTGYDSSYEDGKATLPSDPSSHMITYTFTNGAVATLRTSGTEPKIKYYVEVAGVPGQSKDEVQDLVTRMEETFVNEFLQPEVNGLTSA